MTGEWSKIQRRHFDRELPDYRVMYGADSPFHRAMTGRFLRFAGARSSDAVLDVGCGVGRLTIPLLQSGCRVTGLDLSEPTLEALASKVEQLGLAEKFEAVCRPAEELAFLGEFDLAVGRGILHHLEDPVPVLSGIHAALKPGGRAAFMDPNPYHPGWVPFILLHPTLSWSVERFVLRGTPDRTRGMLESAGFAGAVTQSCGLVPPPLWGRLPKVDALEEQLEKIPLLRRMGLYLMARGVR